MKEKLFSCYYSFRRDSEELIKIERTLMIPKIKDTEDNLSKCLKLYSTLSPEERWLFRIKVGKKSNIFEEEEADT